MDIRQSLINQLTKPTARDKQRRVGPSEIGNPCARCLGRALVNERPQQSFSLYPWLGTAVHAYLETEVFPDAQHEMRVEVGHIAGYGKVSGTCDMWLEEERAVVDWKIVGSKKIKQYRTSGVSLQYRYQAMLYGKGIAQATGIKPKKIAIAFIPRDSGNVKDIWVYEEEWQEEMADAALKRAGNILEHVENHGWEDIESDDDCYTCKVGIWA